MFIVPYNTDAPLYHFPWATIALISLNVMAHLAATMGGASVYERFALEYGSGLHPVQWLTSGFLHAGLWHLAGNMVFLWAFGLVVEGKLGFARFLAVYLGLGVVQAGIEQSAAFWFDQGKALGSSGAIFGIMAMALVWAPENDIECVAGWGFGLMGRAQTFEIPIRWFAGLYIGLNGLMAWMSGFAVSGALLHTLGAMLGTGAALLFLKFGWVDCEGWDLVSILKRRFAGAASADDPTAATEVDRDRQLARAQARLRRALAASNAAASLKIYHQVVQQSGSWMLPEPELLALAELLGNGQFAEDAVPLLEQYLERFTARQVPVRLMLARILVKRQRRPRQALRVLQGLPTQRLSPARMQRLREELAREAQAMVDDGVIEPQGRAW